MKLSTYTPTEPLLTSTLCFLVKDQHILLAMKKRGFGKGKWNGVGGKTEPKEAVTDAIIRETQEEILVTPQNIQHVATLNFHFPYNSFSGQQVHVFLSDKWKGEPQETEEMKPQWYHIKQLPYDQMWPDDVHWLPQIISGSRLQGAFLFDAKESILDFQLKPLENFIT